MSGNATQGVISWAPRALHLRLGLFASGAAMIERDTSFSIVTDILHCDAACLLLAISMRGYCFCKCR
jgi:hypothetical protein